MSQTMMNEEPNLSVDMARDLTEFVTSYVRMRHAATKMPIQPDEKIAAMQIYGAYLAAMVTASLGGVTQLQQAVSLGPSEQVESPVNKETNANAHNHLMKLSGGGKVFVQQDKSVPDSMVFHIITEDANGRTNETKFSIHKGKADWRP